MSWPARVIRALVHAYQLVQRGRPSPCRFSPSCSSYALEALELHGAVRGTWLVLRRVARCHPWGGQGWDPVPHAPSRSPSSESTEPSESSPLDRKVA